jgi:hypothetical protein
VDEVKHGFNVSYDAGMEAYNVRGTSSIIRVVTLHPKETCSCPSIGVCYHLRTVIKGNYWHGKFQSQAKGGKAYTEYTQSLPKTKCIYPKSRY